MADWWTSGQGKVAGMGCCPVEDIAVRDPFDVYDTRPGGTDLRKCARRAGAPESPATAAVSDCK